MADTYKAFTTNGKTNVKLSIYTDLDAILDTRLSVLYFLSLPTMNQVLDDGSYYTRIRENFGMISADIFNSFYDRRDKLALKYAMPTGVVRLIRDYCKELILDPKNMETEENLTIYINTYPYYDLEDEELATVSALIKKYVPVFDIAFIDMSKEELTPVWVMEHIGCMFKYDNYRWLEYHSSTGALYKTPLLDVMYYTPAIIVDDSKDKKADKKFFGELEEMMRYIIDYNILPTEWFCLDMNLDSEEEKK